MDKINKTQFVILWGFIAFYFISLIINAGKAIFGQEDLAIHHWPFFAVALMLGLGELTPDQKARAAKLYRQLVGASKIVIKKTALSLLRWIRAVGCLPALFAKAAKETKEAI